MKGDDTIAINIFSGGSRGGGTVKPQTVPTTTGKEAVASTGTVLSKVANVAEKVSDFLPGPVGGVVKGVAKLFSKKSKNDPEWWMNVPGTGVTTNSALAAFESTSESAGTIFETRAGILEFCSTTRSSYSVGSDVYYYDPLIWPTKSMTSTYLMQNVRKVVNAIPLQEQENYRQVLINQATAYALKHQLDKYIYLTQTTQPFLPSLTDGSYPILAAENYATLVGYRDRLAEYCKASVRLPHTLCAYLAWRYGRVYRSGPSAKAGLVIYDVIPIHSEVSVYKAIVDRVLGFVAAEGTTSKLYCPTELRSKSNYTEELGTVTSTGKQSAQADLFNAFRDHVIDVQIKPETQFIYDPKEFVLRTNLDLLDDNAYVAVPVSHSPELIYMDSDLDNKTTFMASTVSTAVETQGSLVYYTCLFPVRTANAFIASVPEEIDDYCANYGAADGLNWWYQLPGAWSRLNFAPLSGRVIDSAADGSRVAIAMALAVAKNLEYYNAEIYFDLPIPNGGQEELWLDMTAMSQDLAKVATDVLLNTQVYAFANLVYDGVKSYAAKEMPKLIKEAEATQAAVVDAITPKSVTVTPA